MTNTIKMLCAGASLLALSACASALPPSQQAAGVAALADDAALNRPVKMPEPLKVGDTLLPTGQPVTMEALVRHGIANNPLVRADLLGIGASNVGAAQQMAEYMPRLSLIGSVGMTDSGGMSRRGHVENLGLNATWLLYDGGAGEARAKREGFRSLSAAAQAEVNLLGIILGIIEAAETHDLHNRSLPVCGAWKKEVNTLLTALTGPAKGAYADGAAGGIVSQSDVNIIRARLEDVKRRCAKIERDRADAAADLRRTAGTGPVALMKTEPLLVTRDRAQARAEAGDNPTLRVSANDIQSLIQQVIAIDRERGGTLELSVGPALVGALINPVHLLSIGADVLHYGASLDLNGERDLRLKRAILAVEQALNRYADGERAVVRGVDRALNALDDAEAQARLAASARKAHEARLQGVLIEYRAGQRSITEVLDAISGKYGAILDQMTAEHSARFARAWMLAAQGRLLTVMHVTGWREQVITPDAVPFEDLSTLLPQKAAAPAADPAR